MNLFDQAEQTKIDRLKKAGWFCVDLWGQKAWRSPDGRQSTLYTDTAIQWLEESHAAPKPPSEREVGPASPDQQPAKSTPAPAQAD